MIRFRSSSPQFRAALAGSLLFCCLTPLVHAQRSSGSDAVEAGRARYNLDSDDNAGATDNNTTTTTTTRTTRVRRRPATTTVRSYDSSTESTVERARSRYAADAAGAEEHLSVGDSAIIRKDYDLASREYRAAVDALPPAPATADRRQVAVKKFFDATIMLANQRITEGRYVDAETTVKIILRPEYDPGYKPAITLLKHLEDPEYYNQTVTPAFVDRVQKVKQLFIDAQGYYDTARYDLAYKRYEQILALDPYNDAARKGQERVDLARAKHFDPVSYDHTRGRLLTEVDRGWDLPVRRQGPDAESRRNLGKVRDDQGNAALMRKLQSITIPNIEFRSTTVADAIEFLRQESRRLDLDPDPEARGVNIFLKLGTSGAPATRAVAAAPDPVIPGLPTEAGAAAGGGVAPVAGPSASTRITLTMSRLPLLEALRYVAQQAGLKVKVEQYAVSIVPLTEVTDTLVTQEFRVSPTFISSATTGGLTGGALGQGAVSATATGGAGPTDNTGVGTVNIQRQDAKTFLESSGVTFPPGASATYLASTSKLVVRNTQENIDLIESLVQENSPVIKQVEIESKFIEITQQNLKELSFDWTLGQANVPGSSKVFFGGGTSGDGRSVSSTDFPFVNTVTGNVVGGTAVTAGNRSGTYGISANAIDALLFGSGAAAAAPGIFSLAGVFTDPQFQLVVRALNQQKGVDLLSAPRVTTKSGQKATIEIIREFIYPTQFQPPQIPQNFGNSNNNGGGTTILNPLTGILSSGGNSGGTFPVTPTTPTNFEKRNTGVTLEVEPVIGPDNYTIDLNLQPQVVDFDGFVNYGSPIQTTSTNALGITQVNVITPNVINQPIFDTRKVSTSVSVFDGSTVVLGGLVREDVQKVNDKVPILGDVPLVGRLFRSKIDQNIKRNLIIFVTAHLITPDGQLVLSQEEEEESVQPLNGPDYVPATRMQMIPSKK